MRILVIRERVTDVRTKTVSYWDTRAAVRALEGLEENGAFAESKLRVKLSWDDGFEKFAETAGQSSTNPQRPQRERDYNRDRGDRDRNRFPFLKKLMPPPNRKKNMNLFTLPKSIFQKNQFVTWMIILMKQTRRKRL